MTDNAKAEEERLVALTDGFLSRRMDMFFQPISIQQFATSQDMPAKGNVWVARTELPGSDSQSLVNVIRDAISEFGGNSSEAYVIDTGALDVPAQWTGYRAGVSRDEPEPDVDESEKFKQLMSETKGKMVLLHAHGGFYFSGCPATARQTTAVLTRLTGAPCLVPEYRLAPQNPFPAAVVDLFVAYLSLLYPAEGSWHKPVLPENLVLTGESCGGNLALSLFCLIQYIALHRGGQVEFHGKLVDVPFPAGVATVCAEVDQTHSFPSQQRNSRTDFLRLEKMPYLHDTFPTCDLWPTHPPRAEPYCETHFLSNPLVSPAAMPSWPATPPPMFFAYGEERLTDEGHFVAARAACARTGANPSAVQYLQFDKLPHIFHTLFPRLAQTKYLFEEWAKFCCACVEGKEGLRDVHVKLKPTGKEVFERVELGQWEGVDTDLEKAVVAMKVNQAARKPWVGSSRQSSL